MRALPLLAALVAGCASTPRDSEVSPPTRIIDAAAATVVPGRAGVMVKRDLGGEQPSKCDVVLALDGKRVAVLMQGEGLRLYPAPGAHVLGLETDGHLCRADSTIALTVDPSASRSYRVVFRPYVGFMVQPIAD